MKVKICVKETNSGSTAVEMNISTSCSKSVGETGKHVPIVDIPVLYTLAMVVVAGYDLP